MVKNENYKIMLERIRLATTEETLKRLEIACVRLYNAGIYNEKELVKLDTKIMEKLALFK